jgi:hypothetical protein
MSTIEAPPAEVRSVSIVTPPSAVEESRAFLRRAGVFVAIGLLIYLALYAASEWLVHRHAERNRFFAVQSAPHDHYDFVVLGASRAAVFDYRDMNARLEEMTGATILNLSNVGAGIVVNRLLLDYFLESRRTDAVVYVLDSFAFYSSEWNEDRLGDTRLYLRAPLDLSLARLLLRERGARSAAVAYLTGFPKINNADRFEPDRFPGEGSTFDRTYRPIAQIDRQRLEYLYPAGISVTSLTSSPYLTEFDRLMATVRDHGARFIVVRPPIPQRIHDAIPLEREFDELMRERIENHGGEYHDLSLVANDPELFYDSDHLNRAGVLNFFENHLQHLLR